MMVELHEIADSPGWDTKQHCTCGFASVSKCEQWKHASDELRAQVETAERQRDEAIALLDTADRTIETLRLEPVNLRTDALNVLTVYDSVTAPENRGPWRDRLHAWATSDSSDEEHDAMLRLGFTGVHGWYRCEHCGHNQEIDTRPAAALDTPPAKEA